MSYFYDTGKPAGAMSRSRQVITTTKVYTMNKEYDRTLNRKVEIVARPELTRKRRQLEERLERREIAHTIDDFENFFDETIHWMIASSPAT